MIPKDCQGKWEVLCIGNTLSVKKLNDQGFQTSLTYEVGNEEFNQKWYNKPLSDGPSITKDILDSIQWPSYLKGGEHEIINVISSGDFYVDDP